MPFVVSSGELVPAGPPSPIAVPAISRRGITLYPNLTAAYQTIYRTQPNVRSVVSFLGKNIAQLPLRMFRRVDEVNRQSCYDHPVAKLLRNPNYRTSRFSFFRSLVEDLGVFDNFVALKISDSRTQAKMLVRIPPQRVEVLGPNFLFPDTYRIYLPWRPILDVDHTQVVHIYGYNPEDSRWGLSPIETLRRILSEDNAAGEYREQLWSNSARVPGFIERPETAPKWSEGARDRFRQGFRDDFAGNGPMAGGMPVLEEGMTFRPATMTFAEAEYLSARKLTRAEVASAYHVPPGLVGIMEERQTVANAASIHRNMYSDAFGPLCADVAEALALQLIPDFETDPAVIDALTLEFNLEEKLKGDFLTEAEATSRAVGGPIMTRNEARARRQLPPLPGSVGDEIITPLNVLVGGRASPADTAPGSPGAGQAALDEGPDGLLGPAAASRGRKALTDGAADSPEGASALMTNWSAQHTAVIQSFVARQRASVLSALGRGQSPSEAFGQDAGGRFPRWDSDLSDTLAGLAMGLIAAAGAPVAQAFGEDFDAGALDPWAAEAGRIGAESFNDRTFLAVSDLWPAPLSRRQATDDDEPVITDVFDRAAVQRAVMAGINQAGIVTNYARLAAASQAGATTKTWHASPDSSRHAELDGITVPIDGAFPNGGAWPHDPALPHDQTTGCGCLVVFTEAEVTLTS